MVLHAHLEPLSSLLVVLLLLLRGAGEGLSAVQGCDRGQGPAAITLPAAAIVGWRGSGAKIAVAHPHPTVRKSEVVLLVTPGQQRQEGGEDISRPTCSLGMICQPTVNCSVG